jgi:hypothetical protein
LGQLAEQPAIRNSSAEAAEKIDLRGNPIPIPPEILASKQLWDNEPGDIDTILDFYFRTVNPEETEPLYEAKLLLVGEGGAGKTSLAKPWGQKLDFHPHLHRIVTGGVASWKRS